MPQSPLCKQRTRGRWVSNILSRCHCFQYNVCILQFSVHLLNYHDILVMVDICPDYPQPSVFANGLHVVASFAPIVCWLCERYYDHQVLPWFAILSGFAMVRNSSTNHSSNSSTISSVTSSIDSSKDVICSYSNDSSKEQQCRNTNDRSTELYS